MHKGSSKHGGNYNRLSLARHDALIKREPWDYRYPQRRKSRDFIPVRRYEFVHGVWRLIP